ncbi:MAG: glycosyl transferase, partial [Actinomycetota bacterium]|nr:glycosyl transferase [Actinomycetota bacterium]
MPAEDRRLTLLLGAFGDPGHAFPIIALGTELAARGHRVVVDTWRRWCEDIEAGGMEFVPAPEYQVFPTRERPLKPYEAAVRAARETLPRVAGLGADAVVADILTPAPALAAEMAGLPVATLVPHIDPRFRSGWPPFSIGARLPRTRAGRALWRRLEPMTDRGLEQGRIELNETRRRLGLPPRAHVHNGISRELALIATFPQLEYPRPPDPATHAVGPLLWEPAFGEVELPPGDEPLVLVAPSTSQDPEQTLLRAAMAGLADQPVRVLGSRNRREPPQPIPLPANARMVEWVS